MVCALGLDSGSLDPMEKVSWKQLDKTERADLAKCGRHPDAFSRSIFKAHVRQC
jgi:hypothetical protein